MTTRPFTLPFPPNPTMSSPISPSPQLLYKATTNRLAFTTRLSRKPSLIAANVWNRIKHRVCFHTHTRTHTSVESDSHDVERANERTTDNEPM